MVWKRILLFCLCVLGVLAILAGFVLSQKSYVTVINNTATSTDEKPFTPPVYKSGAPEGAIWSPLYLQGVAIPKKGPITLTATQRKEVADFKEKVLARLALSKPLSKEEKSALSISISTTTPSLLGSLTVATQPILHFTDNELAIIIQALEK